MDVSKEDIEEIIDILSDALERLKGTGMPELDVPITEKIEELQDLVDDETIASVPKTVAKKK